ncbi:MAG: response regulator transcription factor [Microcystaceae cyanobacterium]
MGTALIIEDSRTEQAIITQCLQLAGIETSIAQSGEEALEKISNSLPDLIVLDVVLPGRSGFEICRELKNDVKTSQIPIVLCSTKDTEMDKFWGKKQGADAYVPKPIDQDFFINTIRSLMKA